jgi:hypothetical protein
MKRQAAVLSAALAVVVVGIAVVSSNAQPPGPPTGALDLVQRGRESTFRHVDNPPLGGARRPPSPGDVAIIAGTLRDTSNRRVGKVHVTFMRLKGRRKNIVDQVNATFDLKGGQIVMGGVSDGGRVDVVAITGGTGSYAGARGSMRVRETRRAAHFRITFIG